MSGVSWRIAPGDPTCVFVPGVAKPINCGSQERARLIAAAPDLLEACRAAMNMVEGDGMPPDWDLIRAAIAKTEG